MYITDEERVRGIFLGISVGDSLGSTYEGCMPKLRQNLVMRGGGQFDLPKGSVTDDTMMTLAVAETYLSENTFSRDDFLLRMIQIVEKDPKTFGSTTKRLASLLCQGCYPEDSVRVIDEVFGSGTNGSLMRTAPVGVFFKGLAAANEARRVSLFTHYDPLAGEACAAVSVMLAELVLGKTKEEAYATARGLVRVKDLFEGELIPSVDAVEAGRCAISVFMDGKSFQEIIERAVSLGGDTDTIASIAGGLAGAYYGDLGIPKIWVEDLLVREEVLKIAERCILVREK